MKIGDLVKCFHSGKVGIITRRAETNRDNLHWTPEQFWVEWLGSHPTWTLPAYLEAACK